ncbi:hypothetical protein AB1N83_010617 [Pleurotus pulmonarius]
MLGPPYLVLNYQSRSKSRLGEFCSALLCLTKFTAVVTFARASRASPSQCGFRIKAVGRDPRSAEGNATGTGAERARKEITT